MSDDLTNEIVKNRIDQPDCAVGFVLDGYPRDQVQFDFLYQLTKIDLAVVIDLSDQAAVKRLSGRLACKCGLSYHLEYNPPKQPGVCNSCRGELFRRDDDQPDAIKQRLAIYHTETEPLFETFQHEGTLYHVDGGKSIEDVYRSIDSIISKQE